MNSFDPLVANRYPLLSVKSQVVPETSGETSQAVTTYCESPVTPNEGLESAEPAAVAAAKPAQTTMKAPMTPGRPPIACPFCDVGLHRSQKNRCDVRPFSLYQRGGLFEPPRDSLPRPTSRERRGR